METAAGSLGLELPLYKNQDKSLVKVEMATECRSHSVVSWLFPRVSSLPDMPERPSEGCVQEHPLQISKPPQLALLNVEDLFQPIEPPPYCCGRV